MERLLSVSRELRDKVEHNDVAAGELLRQCEELKEELKAMRQVRRRPVTGYVIIIMIHTYISTYSGER